MNKDFLFIYLFIYLFSYLTTSSYRAIDPRGMLGEHEKTLKMTARLTAHDLQALRMFSRHPKRGLMRR